MKIKNRYSILVSILSSSLLFGGPTYYNNSAKATPSNINQENVFALRQKVNALQEEMEGLKSLLESLNQKIIVLSKQNRNKKGELLSQRLSSLEAKVAKLQKDRGVSSRVKTRVTHQRATNIAHKKRDYVDTKLKKKSSILLFREGIRFIKQRRFTEAQRYFNILKVRNYKPAAVNFYLGEIAYWQRDYKEAIDYYEASTEHTENAPYIDILLLHTAIALEKTGDYAQARSFFRAIVDGYPGTSSASIAKKHLNRYKH